MVLLNSARGLVLLNSARGLLKVLPIRCHHGLKSILCIKRNSPYGAKCNLTVDHFKVSVPQVLPQNQLLSLDFGRSKTRAACMYTYICAVANKTGQPLSHQKVSSAITLLQALAA